MKFALLGKSISHSSSPQLYRKIIGPEVMYDLLDYDSEENLPSLKDLAKIYSGINITSPYKKYYIDEVIIDNPIVKRLGIINTISFSNGTFLATNTDLLAVKSILSDLIVKYKKLNLILLGSGAMAEVTRLVARDLSLDYQQLARKTHPALVTMDLTPLQRENLKTIIINACSRDFVFKGRCDKESIFWDYNYRFYPHQNTLPFQVKEYHDGQEMLFLQAKEAWNFWQNNKLLN